MSSYYLVFKVIEIGVFLPVVYIVLGAMSRGCSPVVWNILRAGFFVSLPVPAG